MSPRENGRDLAMEAKIYCAHKKAGFTRKQSTFQYLVDTEVQGSMLQEAYEALDASNISYVKLVDESRSNAKVTI